MTSSFREIYDRHRGSYHLIATTKSGSTVRFGPFNAEEAHEEARVLVGAADQHIVSVHVYSNTEGQYIGAVYKRGETYRPWSPEEPRDGRLELSLEQPESTLLSECEEPVPPMDDTQHDSVSVETVSTTELVPDVPATKATKPRAAKLPGDRFPTVRGKQLAAVFVEGVTWPASAPAQAVREFFTPERRATSAEVISALGETLKAMGVAHPGSLVSRLKQAGLLKEVE